MMRSLDGLLREHVEVMRELAEEDAKDTDRFTQGMAVARKADATTLERILSLPHSLSRETQTPVGTQHWKSGKRLCGCQVDIAVTGGSALMVNVTIEPCEEHE